MSVESVQPEPLVIKRTLSEKRLAAPLFTAWSDQLLRLVLKTVPVGRAARLSINGEPASFQYTGSRRDEGAEVLVHFGFEANQTQLLGWESADQCDTDLSEVVIDDASPRLQYAGRSIRVPELRQDGTVVVGPLSGFNAFPLVYHIRGAGALLSRTVTRINQGPLYAEWRLSYQFADHRRYELNLRLYRHEPIAEITEIFSLGMGAELVLVLNPQGRFDHILSHQRLDFGADSQPFIEPLGQERPRDVLCRLQMPPLGEYAIPNNRGWFALFDSRHEEQGMLGIMGLYGPKWQFPVQNLMQVYDRGGRAELHAPLEAGQRHWLLYAGPVQKQFTPENRLVFDRLHAEFNALRLDEHLDLSGGEVYDASCWNKPGFFGEDYRAQAQRNVKALPPLAREIADGKSPQPLTAVILSALLEPASGHQQALVDAILSQFRKWVRQFQGWRCGEPDYEKNVIGFPRRLRQLMIGYELLRKDGVLSEEQIGQFGCYFAFAARRICDEGRWPHSKTWMHPDHPQSTRDFYTYPGEHKPDRLVWTNCLPNFQSDPMAALLHLSALIPDHPDAAEWRRFALDDLERQLDAYCGKESGAWEESINYALFTFSYFVTAFRILKNRCGIDYFQDARFRRYAGWLTRFLGPADLRFGGAHTYPAIGNAFLPQNQGEGLLAFAGELAEDDSLRHDLIACYQRMEPHMAPGHGNYPLLLVISPLPDRQYPLRPLVSEQMDEMGVAMRHAHPSPQQSYLFQKIGFWKDHYEADETAFNWYAKGVPLCMDYGTYSGDAMGADAHNLVQIPDEDPLRRGYLADRFFSPVVDYTRCECPVTLKLSHGKLRSFAEIDGPPQPPLYYYIGDENPIGPKVWKTRLLLFVKPDYLLILDRISGPVPHRYNLHVTADEIQRKETLIRATGRFGLDLLCFVQHPSTFEFSSGELAPAPERYGRGKDNPHRQRFFRLQNTTDGIYRTVLFAQEQNRKVLLEKVGSCGVKITTDQYTDYAFISDEMVSEHAADVSFRGRVGWIRRESGGRVRASLIDGEEIAAHGLRLTGRGPWSYNMDGSGSLDSRGTPRPVQIHSV